MNYIPSEYVLIQHAFVLIERAKHVAAIKRKWEAKKAEQSEKGKRKKK